MITVVKTLFITFHVCLKKVENPISKGNLRFQVGVVKVFFFLNVCLSFGHLNTVVVVTDTQLIFYQVKIPNDFHVRCEENFNDIYTHTWHPMAFVSCETIYTWYSMLLMSGVKLLNIIYCENSSPTVLVSGKNIHTRGIMQP